MAVLEEPKDVEKAKEETQVAPQAAPPAAPVTPATIRKDLVAEFELLSERALGKLTGYAKQSLAAIGSMLDGLDDDDQKPPAKDAPAEKKD